MKKIALLSVFNKRGIVEFAQELIHLGFDIMASGGKCPICRKDIKRVKKLFFA